MFLKEELEQEHQRFVPVALVRPYYPFHIRIHVCYSLVYIYLTM